MQKFTLDIRFLLYMESHEKKKLKWYWPFTDGYQATQKSELKVTKKKTNILDKMPPTGKVKSEEDGKAVAVSTEALEKVKEVSEMVSPPLVIH